MHTRTLPRPEPGACAVPGPGPGRPTLTRVPEGQLLTEWNLLLKINFCQTRLHMNTASLWWLLWFLETNIGPTVAKSKGQFRTIPSLDLWTWRHSQQLPQGPQRHLCPRQSNLAPPLPTPALCSSLGQMCRAGKTCSLLLIDKHLSQIPPLLTECACPLRA